MIAIFTYGYILPSLISHSIINIIYILFIGLVSWFIYTIYENDNKIIFPVYSFIVSVYLIMLFVQSTNYYKYSDSSEEYFNSKKIFLHNFFPDESEVEIDIDEKINSMPENLSIKEKKRWNLETTELKLIDAENEYYFNLKYYIGFSFLDYIKAIFLSITFIFSIVLIIDKILIDEKNKLWINKRTVN